MNLDPRDAGHVDAQPSARQHPEQEPMATDREVSLASVQTPEAIHAWLDGEPVSESQLQASGKEYALWQRVEAETGRRRRMTTPAHVPAQIMSVIKNDG